VNPSNVQKNYVTQSNSLDVFDMPLLIL